MRLPETSATVEELRSFFDWQIEKLEDLDMDEVFSRSLGLLLYYNALPQEQRVILVDRIVEFMTALKTRLSETPEIKGLADYTLGVGSSGSAELRLRFYAHSHGDKNP